jgi:hypothetical protein
LVLKLLMGFIFYNFIYLLCIFHVQPHMEYVNKHPLVTLGSRSSHVAHPALGP